MQRVLTIIPFILFAELANAASFDCSKAATLAERTICSDGQLSELDSQLAQSYKKLVSDPARADFLKSEQKTWLKDIRNMCQDVECMKQAYSDRLSVLTNLTTSNQIVPVEISPTAQNTTSTPLDNTFSQAHDGATKLGSEVKQPTDQDTGTQTVITEAAGSRTTNQTAEATPSKPLVKQNTLPDEVKSASKTTEETEKSAPAAVDFTKKPDSGISDLATAILNCVIGLFFIGMLKPSWILRWDIAPTRKKLVMYLFALGFPLGALAEFSKSEPRKKYDDEIRIAKKTEEAAIQKQQDVARASYVKEHATSQLVQDCVDSALQMGYIDGMCAHSYINACVSTQSRSEMSRTAGLDKVLYGGRLNVGGCPNMPTTYVNQFNAQFAKRDKF